MCVVTRVVLLHFVGPIKIAITRRPVYYTYDGLIALERFASDESCFKYNIRDAMPSICYDDDSANAKNHRGNRRNCIDAAPFSLWLVTSFFFLSFFFSVTHASSSSILQIDRYCCARVSTKPISSAVAVILKATTVSDRGPRSLSLRVSYSDSLPLHPFVRGATQRCIFLARLYDGLRKRQWQWLKIRG